MHPVLRSVIEAAEPIRARLAVWLAARPAVFWAEAQSAALAVRGWLGREAPRVPSLMVALVSGALSLMLALIARVLRPLGQIGSATTHPLLRMFVGEVHAVMLRVFAYGCALGALGLVVSEFVALPQGSVVASSDPELEWLEVNKPFPAFAMTLPEFEDTRYAIWRHANGGGRKDIFTFGKPGATGATAVVELYRPGMETDDPGEPEDVTASIPDLRLSGRPILARTIDTKFGAITVEPFTDRAPDGDRRCLRFMRSFEEPRLDIGGWFCNAGEELVDRGMIACALDRLTLLAAGGEPKIGTLFARAEQRRTFCGTQSVFVAATPKRHDWIEAARDPRLRGRQ